MPPELVGKFLATTDVESLLTAVETLSGHDRYQASAGINDAAGFVAQRADEVGLIDVAVHRYPADGRPQWWSFEAPMSWTPECGVLSIRPARSDVPGVALSYGDDPFALATYSAATAEGRLRAPLVAWPSSGLSTGDPRLRGSVVALSASDYVRPGVLSAVESSGACGFVTAGPARGDHGGSRGRIELPLRSALFAFGLTGAEFGRVELALRHGDLIAEVDIRLGPTADMPVVTADLPGSASGAPIWLMAHLCHPGPGANDNASGVAGLLGVAELLVRHMETGLPRRTIRFCWGPEFVGTAALLHRCSGKLGIPAAVLNLDMIGEDQHRCASPFVLERSPDQLPSLINPVAERIVGEVFAATGAHPGRWQPSPFMGFSDHALFADPAIARPAVQFCHPADRFNHSAGDTLDKVSPVEMTRSVAAAAALTDVVAGGAPLAGEIDDIVEGWERREQVRVRRIADHHRARHPAWSDALLDRASGVARRHRELARRRDILPEPAAGSSGNPDSRPGRLERATPTHPAANAPRRRWSGPLNVRAMIGATSPSTRRTVAGLIAEDKRNLALLFHVGIGVDGRRSWSDIFDDVSTGIEVPVPPKAREHLTDVFEQSDWTG